MKCILHIGTEKTGTTILQDWLYDNQFVLSEEGIYLSQNLGKTNNRLFSAYFQSFLDDWAIEKGITDEDQKNKYFSGFLDKFASEISNASDTHKVCIISSEHLHSRVREKKEIQYLHSFLVSIFDEVEVVCYFRDQFDVAVSLYSTAIKIDKDIDVDRFVEQANPENYYYNYVKIADNWSEVFGRNNCNFRIYDRSRFIGNDIRIDFLNSVKKNINLEKLNMTRKTSNESLSLFQTAAFKVINRKIPYWNSDKIGTNKNNFFAKDKILKLDSLKYGKIFSTKNELIRDRFKETNKMFFEKYFSGNNLFLDIVKKDNITITSSEATTAIEDALEFGINLSIVEKKSLTEEQINSLVNISQRLYDYDIYFHRDALSLMKIAEIFRPHGPLIKSKIKEWSKNSNS